MRPRAFTRALQTALLATLLAGPAMSQERASTQVEVWEIRATNANKEISPELRPIADELKRKFRHTGFKVVGKHSGRVNLNETFIAKLTAHHTVKVTPTNRDAERIQMKVEIKRLVKKKVNTVVTMRSGGGLQFWSWSYPRSEDTMIIGIRAR